MRPHSSWEARYYMVVILIGRLFVPTTRIVAAMSHGSSRGVVLSTMSTTRTIAMMVPTLPRTKVSSAHERVPPIVLAAHIRMRDTSTFGRRCSSRSSLLLPTRNWNRCTIERVEARVMRTTKRTGPALPAFASYMSSLSSTSSSSTTDVSLSNDEERYAYAELVALSKRIRALDKSYYGHDDDDGTTINSKESAASAVSDDEYDALARREAELCISFPHLQVMLENETGLGSRATRYGGRVGRIIVDNDNIGDNNDEKSSTEEVGTKSTKKKRSKTTSSSRTKSKTIPKQRIKRQHLVNSPMLSLDNAMNDNEAISWLNRVRNLLFKEEASDTVRSSSNVAINNNDTSDDTNTTICTTRTIQILAEPKIDGLGLSLRYRLVDDTTTTTTTTTTNDNKTNYIYQFVWGATRGDGTKGEDVTEAVRSAWMMMMGGEEGHNHNNICLPQSLAIPKSWNSVGDDQQHQPPDELEIRGEVVLPKKAFDDLFLNSGTVVNDADNNDSISSSSSSITKLSFSNARNAASGILLRSKDTDDLAEAEQTQFLRSQLRFYAYDFVASASIEENDVNYLTSIIGNDGIEMRDKLTSLGFCVPSPVVLESLNITAGVELDISNISNLLMYHRNLMSARDGNNTNFVTGNEHNFPYQIDGVVYKLSSFNDRQICGSSSRAPRWAIAHKFPSTSAVTRLLNIEIQVGRTGALTPVAILEPVSLSGVMVSRASLHNFHFARKLLLPAKKSGTTTTLDSSVDKEGSIGVKKGISLLVGRAGDVIPQVKKRVFEDDDDDNDIAGLHSNEMISLNDPHECPACGSPATFFFVTATTTIKRQKMDISHVTGTDKDESIDDNESIDAEVSGQVLRCSGPQLLCPPRAVNGLAYAYSRAGLDVKGLSKAKIGQLMEEGIIRFPADLFVIYGGTKNEDFSAQHDVSGKIVDLPGWGELSSQNIAESIRSVATAGVPLSRYIYSLGIPQIGTHASQLVASKYRSVGTFLNAVEEASLYENNGKADMNEVETEEVITPFASLTGSNGSEKVKGIGPTAIAALIAFSRTEVLVKAAKDLAAVLTVHDDDNINSLDNDVIDGTMNSPFHGMTVVFTGSLPGMSRAMAQNAVKALGAKSTPNTVSKSTSLVVDGDQEGLSKKSQKARELGIRVINYTEFMRLIESVNNR